MTRLLPLLLMACDPLPAEVDAPDGAAVAEAWAAAQPAPLLALREAMLALPAAGAALPAGDLAGDPASSEGGCPLIEVVEGEEGAREVWTGGCVLPADGPLGGALVEGTLVWGEGAPESGIGGSTWIAGSGFTVSRNGQVELYFDGALEQWEQGDLLVIDASAAWCAGAACLDGTVTVDLSFSLFPYSPDDVESGDVEPGDVEGAGYPDIYDVTVSGVVLGDEPIAVEGSWSVDRAACALEEPANGSFAVRRGERHDLTFDGAARCDDCAEWAVQGSTAPAWCGL